MLLTPQWKKWVLPQVMSKIYLGFNKEDFKEILKEVVNHVQWANNDPGITGVKYQGQYHTYYSGPANYYTVVPSDAIYPRFTNALSKLELSTKLGKSVNNYIATGLAICHTVDCVCEVFPECVLSKFNEVVHSESKLFFKHKDSTTPKIIAFIEKNKDIEAVIKKQLLVNIIAPGQVYAQNNVQ